MRNCSFDLCIVHRNAYDEPATHQTTIKVVFVRIIAILQPDADNQPTKNPKMYFPRPKPNP